MVERSTIERRLTLRLVTYWEHVRGARLMPHENDIDPDAISDLWPHCFLVQMRDVVKTDYNYTYLGPAIFEAYNGDLIHDHDCPLVSPNASKLELHYAEVVATARPVLEENEFVNLSGQRVLFRQCMLPLGTGDRVESIFGGMRFRIIRRT
jgi:hypothetical protein